MAITWASRLAGSGASENGMIISRPPAMVADRVNAGDMTLRSHAICHKRSINNMQCGKLLADLRRELELLAEQAAVGGDDEAALALAHVRPSPPRRIQQREILNRRRAPVPGVAPRAVQRQENCRDAGRPDSRKPAAHGAGVDDREGGVEHLACEPVLSYRC